MYTYPSIYKAKSVATQVKILKKYFKGLRMPEYDTALHGYEALFVIPHWNTLGTYNEACEKVFSWIAKERKFYNWSSDKMGPERMRQGAKKAAMWEKAGKVIVVPLQLGQRYAGKSIREARQSMGENEWGLGAYEGAIIALTHPERFQTWEELDMDLPGDELHYQSDSTPFSRASALYFSGDGVYFGYGWLDAANGRFGSASGFSPQKLESRTLDTFESLTLESAIKIVKKEGYVIYKPI